jgi:hypothetical protein
MALVTTGKCGIGVSLMAILLERVLIENHQGAAWFKAAWREPSRRAGSGGGDAPGVSTNPNGASFDVHRLLREVSGGGAWNRRAHREEHQCPFVSRNP